MASPPRCACQGQTLPRLIRPWILAILASDETHGYVIAQQLAAEPTFGERSPDATGIYRALKEMEAEGYVVSHWDLAESGPAKRVYGLTAAGRGCLHRWQESLEEYRQAVDALLARLEASPAVGEELVLLSSPPRRQGGGPDA